jgi:hypothetical protein
VSMGGDVNFSRINPEYNDPRPSFSQQTRIVDFVLLDTTSQSIGGQAYQLLKDITFTEDEMKDIKKGNFNLPRNPFSPLGTVKEVKLTPKQLILDDGNTIQYQHLVVVRGTHPSLMSYEFLSALYTLVDALRVQKWIPEAMLLPVLKNKNVTIHATQLANESNDIWLDHLPSHQPSEGTFLYAESNRKLYQVHL